MPSEIGFPTLTSDVCLNQKPNKLEICFRKNLAKLTGSAVRINSKKPKGNKTMKQKNGSSHAWFWTCIPTSSSEKSTVSDHSAMRPLHQLNVVLKYLSLPFTLFEPYSKIHLRKNRSNEYFKTILHYFRAYSLLGRYLGRSINELVFFFAGLAEVQVTVLLVWNRRRQGFPATCSIGHCCFCSLLLFTSETLCDSPTFNKQRMNKMSPSRWTCCLETQSARWRHVQWRLWDLFMACC